MQTKYKILIGVIALAVAFAWGRHSAPTKIVTETKIVEVEKKVKDTETEKHKKTTTHEVTHPDGSKDTSTTTEEDTDRTSHSQDDTSRTETDKKEVSRAKGLAVSVLLGSALPPAPVYGAHLATPLLGPITIGVWGLSSGVGGFSLGLNF